MPNWDPEANELFLRAVEFSTAEERQQFLQKTCADQPSLLARVEGLLRASEQAGSFLEQPAADPRGTAAHVPGDAGESAGPRDRAGTTIGPYKLIEEVGEGGMGTVYLAQQSEPVRRLVAVKLVKPGMDSRQVLARFEAERQALALMDHPNIAKVFDAGATPDGRPYFVMELVKGVPITKYCDDLKLGVRDRLALFADVCRAVQHAHQKGIIHRDVKPSNVLVAPYDGKPVVKVIDFGIAKAAGQPLTDRTLVTGLGAVVGTPEYMSPEQAELNNLDIDTRADVYSLGVLLYELLTGTTPLTRKRVRDAALFEVLRVIREEEPPKPSTRLSGTDELPSIAANRGLEPRRLSGVVRGELDWIVMKALEKDRNRRYESANGFALDVLRFLADEPVQACPPSARYRLRKFARRNKGRLAVAAGVFLAVTAMAVTIGWAVRDRAARADAAERTRIAQELEFAREREVREEALNREVDRLLNQARELSELGKWPEALVLVERADKLLTSAGRPERPSRMLALQSDLSMAQRMEEMAQDPERDQNPKADTDFLRPYREYDARCASAFREFGIDIDALEPAEAAARIGRSNIRLTLLKGLDDWARVRKQLGKGTDTGWKKLVEIARQADRDEWRNRLREAWLKNDRPALERLADTIPFRDVPPATLQLLGEVLLSLTALEKGMSVLKQAQRLYPDDLWINDTLAGHSMRGANPRLDDAVRYYSVLVSLRPRSPRWHRDLAFALRGKGAKEEAFAEFARVIELSPGTALAWYWRGQSYSFAKQFKNAIADFSKAIELDPNMYIAHANLGESLWSNGQRVEAIAAFREALRLTPNEGLAHQSLGVVLRDSGQLDEAIRELREAIRLSPLGTRGDRGSPDMFKMRFDLGVALYLKGLQKEAMEEFKLYSRFNPPAYLDIGQFLYEKDQFSEAITSFREAMRFEPYRTDALHGLGLALWANRQLDDAIVAFREAARRKPDLWQAHYNLGRVLHEKGQLDEAATSFRAAIALNPNVWGAHHHLGDTLRMQRKYDEAVGAYKKALAIDPKSVPSHINLGGVLIDQHKPAEALDYFSKALVLDPKSVDAWNNRGLVYSIYLGQPTKAVTDFSNAIEFSKKGDPSVANSLLSRGVAYGRLGQFDKAAADYSKIIELDSKHAGAWFNRGVIYCDHLGQPEKAVVDFSRVIELNPPFVVNAWFARGDAYSGLKQYDKAVADYSKVIEFAPLHVNALVRRGGIYCDRLNQPEKAIADFSKAIQLNPKSAGNWFNRGYAYSQLGQHEKAVADYSKAIELDLKAEVAFVARYNRSISHANLGQYDKAIDDAKKAIELDPKHAGAHNDLAWLLSTCPDAKLRDPKRAVELAKRAVELARLSGKTWSTLGTAHYRAGDWKAAVAALEKARLLGQGGNASNWLFLAMAHRKLGSDDEARKAFDRAVLLIEKNKEAKDKVQADELRRFQSEAEDVLELKKK